MAAPSRAERVIGALTAIALLSGCSVADNQPTAEVRPPTTVPSPPRTTVTAVSLSTATPTSSVCALLRTDEVAWLTDYPGQVERVEEPVRRKPDGNTTYQCDYRDADKVTFAALTILYLPNGRTTVSAAFEGATRNRADVTPVPNVGDLAATYADAIHPGQRGIATAKRLGDAGVLILLSAHTAAPDTVTSRLPETTRHIVARLDASP